MTGGHLPPPASEFGDFWRGIFPLSTNKTFYGAFSCLICCVF